MARSAKKKSSILSAKRKEKSSILGAKRQEKSEYFGREAPWKTVFFRDRGAPQSDNCALYSCSRHASQGDHLSSLRKVRTGRPGDFPEKIIYFEFLEHESKFSKSVNFP